VVAFFLKGILGGTNMRALVLASLSLFALCDHALAWGDTGHQVVCEIAFRLVSTDTRAAIRRLIKNDQQYDTFTESCIFPDHPHKRGSEHFINLDRNAKDIPNDHCSVTDNCEPKCPTAPKCLLTAIKNDFDILSDKRNNRPRDRLIALKYLGHWVGDIHQPLHVSFEDDRGGNSISVSGECSGKFHSAWDTCLVELAVGDDVSAAADDLLATPPSAAVMEKLGASDPRDWANESFVIAEDPKTKYCVKTSGSCDASSSGHVEIDAAYVEMAKPIIRDRLVRAGVRLAHLLDEAFGD
jgi:S1/P1 Nuclease